MFHRVVDSYRMTTGVIVPSHSRFLQNDIEGKCHPLHILFSFFLPIVLLLRTLSNMKQMFHRVVDSCRMTTGVIVPLRSRFLQNDTEFKINHFLFISSANSPSIKSTVRVNVLSTTSTVSSIIT